MPSKPWTPYAKSLEAACGVLADGLEPAPFGTMAKAGLWIGARTFIEIISTDLEARDLIRCLLEGRPDRYRQDHGRRRHPLGTDAALPVRPCHLHGPGGKPP